MNTAENRLRSDKFAQEARKGRKQVNPDISPGPPRLLAGASVQPIQGRSVCVLVDLGATRILAGFWRVLAGHIGHARLANSMIYWLRRSSPIWLAQSCAMIPRPDEISGLACGWRHSPTFERPMRTRRKRQRTGCGLCAGPRVLELRLRLHQGVLLVGQARICANSIAIGPERTRMRGARGRGQRERGIMLGECGGETVVGIGNLLCRRLPGMLQRLAGRAHLGAGDPALYIAASAVEQRPAELQEQRTARLVHRVVRAALDAERADVLVERPHQRHSRPVLGAFLVQHRLRGAYLAEPGDNIRAIRQRLRDILSDVGSGLLRKRRLGALRNPDPARWLQPYARQHGRVGGSLRAGGMLEREARLCGLALCFCQLDGSGQPLRAGRLHWTP